jgi:hypothetical protein
MGSPCVLAYRGCPELVDWWKEAQLMRNMGASMRAERVAALFVTAALVIGAGCQPRVVTVTQEVTRQVTVPVTQPPSPLPSLTIPPRAKASPTKAASLGNPLSTQEPGLMGIAPYPDAPLCSDSGDAHDNSLFHTLWDPIRGCHYDHEHGENPFTAEVAAAFPGFDLKELLGGVEVGHTDPSSSTENTKKHGGFKWQVDLNAPQGCAVGFEGGDVAVDAYAIQYHTFGPESVEFEARRHSSSALMRQCKPGNPEDKGYIYVVQLEDFGQRVSPYQGTVLPYPDSPSPAYKSSFGPYFTADCVGAGMPGCRTSVAEIMSSNSNANSIWTSKPTGSGPRPETSQLFRFLFRVRDTYQVFDSTDQEHPFTWLFVCGGAVYDPAGCRYNNSTTTIHEIAGNIPASWDGLAGFDTDPRPGRITAQGFVTKHGDRNPICVAANPDLDCYPIKMVGAFVGYYSSELSAGKVSNPTPEDTPERDIYFCNGVPCSETSPGAVPSGWIGPNN